MLCKFCGSQLEEGAKVCANCGAEVPAVEQQPVFNQADFSEQPKKKKNLLPVIIIAAVVVVVGILAAVLLPALSGALSTPEDYFRKVEKQAVMELVDQLTENSSQNQIFPAGATGTIEVKISDMLMEMTQLEQSLGMEMDWLQELALDFQYGANGQQAMANWALKLSDVKVVDLSAVVDMAENMVYLGLPMLSDTYLSGTMEDMNPEVRQSLILSNMDGLPNDKELKKLVEKYLDILLEKVESVEKSEETLSVGGVEQKVTALEYKLTEQALLNMVQDVLKEAKDDEELKKIIVAMAGNEEAYKEFQKGIDDTLADLATVEPLPENYLLWTVYVGSKNKVVGREITMEEQVLYCATATKGKEFATVFTADGVTLTGEGTVEKGVRKGEYLLIAEEQELLEAELEYDEENGQMELELQPTETLLSLLELDAQTLSVIKTMDLSLELKCSAKGNNSEVELNVQSKGLELLGIAIRSETADVSVKLPDSNKVMPAEQAEKWLETVDFEKVAEALEDAGVPSELLGYAMLAMMGM